MPRVASTGSSLGQTYTIGLSDGGSRYGHSSSRTMLNGLATTTTTTTTTTSTTSPRPTIEPAPSSANSLPRVGSLSRTPSIPAPQSLKTSSSMYLRSPGPRLSPVRLEAPVDLPSLQQNDFAPQKPARTTILRAAENGKGSILPDYHAAPTTIAAAPTSGMRNREPPNRHKTRSTPSLKQMMNLGGVMKQRDSSGGGGGTLPQTQHDLTPPSSSMLQSSKHSLRRRTYSTTQSDDEDTRRRSSSNDSHYRSRSRNNSARHLSGGGGQGWLSWHKFNRLKLGHILQVVIVVAVTALVWESHHKALDAVEQLSRYKEEESLMLLHLQKIEQHSIQLHENLSRLAQSDLRARGGDGERKGAGDVDFDLIHIQTQELYRLEEALNHEVRTLQTSIQKSARDHIVDAFGEGPVQVVLELDFGGASDPNSPNTISILLWGDTPHAAWTWLEQIGRHIWDGAQFDWEQGHLINVFPQVEDPMGGRIEFIEHSKHSHERWTVGLRETESGMMSMYVNLQDNTNLHKHETCVGKVVDGFAALQRLLEVLRSQHSDSKSVISIKKATGIHVTKKMY